MPPSSPGGRPGDQPVTVGGHRRAVSRLVRGRRSRLTGVSSVGTRVFVARLAGTSVFDPLGDQVGRVRDVVVLVRPKGAPRAVGLVVEVGSRRRVFLPLTRVTSIDSGQVISTGLVNMRRFEQRAFETLAVGELLDRTVEFVDGSGVASIEDVAIELQRNGDWVISKLFVRAGPPGRPRHPAPPRRDAAGLGRRGHGPRPGDRRAGRRAACSRSTRTSSPPTSPTSCTTSA